MTNINKAACFPAQEPLFKREVTLYRYETVVSYFYLINFFKLLLFFFFFHESMTHATGSVLYTIPVVLKLFIYRNVHFDLVFILKLHWIIYTGNREKFVVSFISQIWSTCYWIFLISFYFMEIGNFSWISQ